MTLSQNQAALEIARQAFDRLTEGLAQGNWEPFLDMVADDFKFWFPIKGKYAGWNEGKDRAREFFSFVSEVFQSGINVVSIESIASNENTVFFEFRDEGQRKGLPYKNRIVLVFEVRDGKICNFREYAGSDGTFN